MAYTNNNFQETIDPFPVVDQPFSRSDKVNSVLKYDKPLVVTTATNNEQGPLSRIAKEGLKLAATVVKDRAKEALTDHFSNRNNNNNNNNNNNGRTRKRPEKPKEDGPPKEDPSDGGGKSRPKRNPSSSDSGGSGGTTGRKSKSSIQWSSGLGAGLIVNPRLIKPNVSPIFLSSGWLFKLSDDNLITTKYETYLYTYLRNVTWPLIRSVMGTKNTRFNERFTDVEQFVEWFDAITTALQVYYCVDNVLAYNRNNSLLNINPGMEALKSRISPSALMEFELLRSVLERQTIPKTLLNYISFMCQSYRTSQAPYSPIIKINVGGMFDGNWVGGTKLRLETLITDCRTKVNRCSNFDFNIKRSFDNWHQGRLPESTDVALFNINFITFWHNMNCTFRSEPTTKTYSYTHTIKSVNDYMNYQIHQEDTQVDGTIFATASTFVQDDVTKQTIKAYWGLWMPLASDKFKDVIPGDPRDTFTVKCVDTSGIIVPVLDSIMLGRTGINYLVEFTGGPGTWKGECVEFGNHGFVDLQVVSPIMQQDPLNNTMTILFGF